MRPSDISPNLGHLKLQKKLKYAHLFSDFLYPTFENTYDDGAKNERYFALARNFKYPQWWDHIDPTDKEYYLKRHYSSVGLKRLMEYEKRLSDIGWNDAGEDWVDGYIPQGEEEWLANYNPTRPDNKSPWEQDPHDKNLMRMKNLEDEVRRTTIASAQTFREWKRNRLPKREYYERKAEIEREGIGEVELIPQKTDSLYSLKVTFPRKFKHLSSKYAQQQKADTNSGYHISLMYEPKEGEWYDYDHERLREEIGKYFGTWDDPRPRKFMFDKIRVSKGSTYELYDDTPFVHLLNKLSKRGTDKWAHISLD